MIPLPSQSASAPKLLRRAGGEVFESVVLVVEAPDVVNIAIFK
jgi:hypothetical protein